LIVVDTSSLVAILLFEPLRRELLEKIYAQGGIMAAPSVLEAYMVLRKHYGEQTQKVIDETLVDLDIEIVPFSAEHAKVASQAFDQFGKGHHPAGLNFGDCIAYALAKGSGQALLFVGDDFGKTDVKLA